MIWLSDLFYKAASKASRICVLITALCCFNACLTFRNNKAIDEYKSSINEFDRSLKDGKIYRVLRGRMTVDGARPVLQFDDVLLGRGRYLNVASGPSGMRFYESRTRITGGKTVYLIQQNACCMDDRAFRSILFLKAGDQADPAAILKQHFSFDAGPVDFPAALLVMDFSNIYTFSAMHPYWEQGAVVTYFVQAPGTDYNEVMNEIEWVERNRFTLASMYAWYAVAVPVDIVTSPFQLAGLLLLGSGMPK